MTLTFRNVDIDPEAPLHTWPYEALVTLIERGSITDWARVTAEIRSDPWGLVARQVEDYLGYARPVGVAGILERAIDAARQQSEHEERVTVAARVGELVAASGLTTAEFASRIGTSRTRLSTYRTGRVTPSAALLVRMERLVARTTARRSVASAGLGHAVVSPWQQNCRG